MDDFKIGQLTKELVAARLRKMGDPCACAADLVRQTLTVALKGMKPGQAAESRIVEDACQGGMTGLLLSQQDLPRGATLILEIVVDLAHQLNLDQTEMMRSALKGIADMRRFVQPSALHEISRQIEGHYHGAGDAFDLICRELPSGRETPSREAEPRG